MYVVLPASLFAAALLAVGPADPAARSGTRLPHDAVHGASPSHAAEVQRIRAHFDRVLAGLPGRDVRALDSRQWLNRRVLLAALRAYRDAGVFPHNYDFPGRAVPYFVDRRTGTLCAVGHLLALTGRRDIVDRVAARDNNVWVSGLAGDTAFVAWLDSHGLTLDEAAWIQVPYVMDESPVASVVSRDPMYNMASTLSTATATTLGLVNVLGNRDGHGSVRSIAGMAAGVISLGVGAAGLAGPNASPVAAASALSGGMSLVFSARGFLRQRELRTARREAEGRRVAQATIAPIVPVDAGRSTGVSVAIRF